MIPDIFPKTSVGFKINALYIAICFNQTCPGAKHLKPFQKAYDSIFWS